jgi:hypothetical protein
MAETASKKKTRQPGTPFEDVIAVLTKQGNTHGQDAVRKVAAAFSAFEGDPAVFQAVAGALSKQAVTHGAVAVRTAASAWAEFIGKGLSLGAPSPNGQAG